MHQEFVSDFKKCVDALYKLKTMNVQLQGQNETLEALVAEQRKTIDQILKDHDETKALL